ncbi:MAG: hypothetical protein MHM6MM_006812 [Cercozoa sp. M6MM]
MEAGSDSTLTRLDELLATAQQNQRQLAQLRRQVSQWSPPPSLGSRSQSRASSRHSISHSVGHGASHSASHGASQSQSRVGTGRARASDQHVHPSANPSSHVRHRHDGSTTDGFRDGSTDGFRDGSTDGSSHRDGLVVDRDGSSDGFHSISAITEQRRSETPSSFLQAPVETVRPVETVQSGETVPVPISVPLIDEEILDTQAYRYFDSALCEKLQAKLREFKVFAERLEKNRDAPVVVRRSDSAELSLLRKQLKQAHESIEKYRSDLNATDKQCRRLRALATAAQREKAEAEGTLEALHTKHASELAATERARQRAEHENARLRRELEEEREARKELQRDVEQSQREVSESRASLLPLQKRCSKLESQLRSALARLKEAEEDARSQMSFFETHDYERLSKQHENLVSQLQKLRHRVEIRREEVKLLRNENDELRRNAADSLRHMRDAQQLIEAQKQRIEKLESQRASAVLSDGGEHSVDIGYGSDSLLPRGDDGSEDAFAAKLRSIDANLAKLEQRHRKHLQVLRRASTPASMSSQTSHQSTRTATSRSQSRVAAPLDSLLAVTDQESHDSASS